MKPFEYLEPKTVAEACSLLSEYRDKAKILAGGQSLVVLMKSRMLAPEYLVSIKNLHDLEYIREDGNNVKIGALTTHRAVEKSPVIQKVFPIISDAVHRLGHVQIRNWGTIGGDLCHADPEADFAPPLIALGAKVKAVSVRGERQIGLEEFFLDFFTTVLEPDEILTEIEVPLLQPSWGGAYKKETIIESDFPIASAATVVGLDETGKTVKDVRIVLGSVGVTPVVAREACHALIGKKVSEKLGEEAGALASQAAQPTTDVLGSAEYKRKLVGLLTRDMVNLAIKRAGQ